MEERLTRDARGMVSALWWAALIRGLAAIGFGLAAVFWPGLTLVVLVYLFAAFILVSGIMNIIMSLVGSGKTSLWWLVFLLGIAEIGVGVYAVRHPNVSLAAVLLIIGFTFLFRGVVEVVLAFMDTVPDRSRRVLLIVSGVLSGLVGIFILMQPVRGGVAFVWALGFYALIVGPISIARASTARHLLEDSLRREALA